MSIVKGYYVPGGGGRGGKKSQATAGRVSKMKPQGHSKQGQPKK